MKPANSRMNQRQSLKFPPRAPSFPSEEERMAQTISIVKYFLTEDRCLMEPLFLSTEEFAKVVLAGTFSNDDIVLRTDIDAAAGDDAMLAVATLTLIADEAVGLIINYAMGNTIAIVGSKDQYYFIDLFHDICYVTKSPEYDIMAYEGEFGESEFTAHYYSTAAAPQAAAPEVGEKRAEPVATAVPPPQKKKKPAAAAAAKKPAAVVATAAPPPTTAEPCEAK